MSRLLMIAVVLSIFAVSLAAQPVCTVDPDTGWISNPTKSGVCFFMKGVNSGFFWYFVGPDGVMSAFAENDKTFERTDRDAQKVWAHFMSRDAELLYCPWSAINADKCSSPAVGGAGFAGRGHLAANEQTDDPVTVDLCPASLHYTGEVTGPQGLVFKLDAVYISVKDKDEPNGCRIVVNQVTLKAK
jgi:hypothetical protein